MDMNLMPVEMLPKRPNKAPYLFVAMMYIFAILFLGTKLPAVKKLHAGIESDKKLLTTLNSNLSKYASAAAELEKVTQEANKLMNKVDAFKNVKNKMIPLGNIVKIVGNLIPEGLWFETLSISYPAEEVHVKGFGKEAVQKKALEFVYSMESDRVLKEFFSKAELVSCTQVTGKKELKAFDIAMVFKKAE